MRKIEEEKADKLWYAFMKAGARSGCHQMAERSFFIGRYQFPVCARCTGVLAGYLAVLLSCQKFKKANRKKRLCFTLFGCDCMLIDWTLQFTGRKQSTNRRRLVTGFLGGVGLMIAYVEILQRIIHFIRIKSE